MTDQAPDTVKKRPWIKIILFASLAFNLLIVGLVVGTVMGGPRDRDKNPILRDLGFGPFVQALDRSEKRALTDAMKQQSGSFRRTVQRSERILKASLRRCARSPSMSRLPAPW